jgi:flagella basal body P-ring formation protein FlgA
MGKPLIFYSLNRWVKVMHLPGLVWESRSIFPTTRSDAMNILNSQSLPKALRVAVFVKMALLMFTSSAMAQSAAHTDYQAQVHGWLQKVAPSIQTSELSSLRLEFVVGSLDSRLKLAPCGNVEPYLPVGMRLWGKTRVGLRCVDGVSRWNVSMPVAVNAMGDAWVVRGQIPAGTVLRQADFMETEVNWAEESSPILKDRALWVGQVATRQLSTGQALRQGMVKPAEVFQAGTQVRVVAQGVGFQVSSDAQALSAGVIGQQARIRMDNGRVTTGVVLDMRTVQIDL